MTQSPICDNDASANWPQGYRENSYGCLEEDLSFEDDVINESLDDACDWFDDDEEEQV